MLGYKNSFFEIFVNFILEYQGKSSFIYLNPTFSIKANQIVLSYLTSILFSFD